MSYSTPQDLLGIQAMTGPSGAVYTIGVAGTAGANGGAGANNHVLVQQRLEEWVWYRNFVEQNPDIKARWEAHKTYEILRHD